MEEIIEYIKRRYDPLSLIIYGSYANGSNNQNSDFDALVISRDHEVSHDSSFVNGIELDVFVYPASYFDGKFDCSDFVQIYDGRILWDTDGLGASLQKQVLSYMDSRPLKTDREIRTEVEWCKKMLLRTKRRDAEGMFRWHWVLVDSLEIFCDAVHHAYFGPKKALRWMEEEYPEAFSIYREALFDLEEGSIKNWVSCLEQLI